MIRMILAIIVTFAILVGSFILTVIAFGLWADWTSTGSTSMAGLGGAVLGLWVAPICALIAGFFAIRWAIRDESD
jgi:hypothetical protein